MNEKPTVTICGCGGSAIAVAADLALMGCSVNLYEHPDFSSNLDPIRDQGGILLTGNSISGKTGIATMRKITSDPIEALEGSDLVMLPVPAQAHIPFFEILAPHFQEGQVIFVNTGYWASLRSGKILEKNGQLGKVTVVEGNILPYASQKFGPAHAHINNYKKDLRFSAFPAKKNDQVQDLIKSIYPQFNASKNVLENNFYPGNPSHHATITVPKAALFLEQSKEYRFYGEVTQVASNLVDAFERERIRVAESFGCSVPHVFEWVPKTYGYPGKDFYEIYGNVNCEHSKRWERQEILRRLIEEDICYFYIPMEDLAKVAGVEVPVTRAITDILSVLAENDYRSKGLTLDDLGLQGMSKGEILEFLESGSNKNLKD